MSVFLKFSPRKERTALFLKPSKSVTLGVLSHFPYLDSLCCTFTVWGSLPVKVANLYWFEMLIELLSQNQNYLRDNKKI